MTRRAASKEPTFTHLVLEQLRVADDFVTVRQLMSAIPELNYNRASASLAHLYKGHAIDMIVSDGNTYWYATPELDDRTKRLEEKVREEPGSRNRRGRQPRTT